MPIRASISDPESREVKAINHKLKFGEPPQPPTAKPVASDVQAITRAFDKLPLGETISHDIWHHEYSLPFLKKVFHFWGVDLAIYPMSYRSARDCQRCNGVMVFQLKRNRYNQPVSLMLKGSKSGWYHELLDWVERVNYL